MCYAMPHGLHVCPTQTGIVSKRLSESSWFSAQHRALLSAYPTLVF